MANPEISSHSAGRTLEAGWMAHMVFAYEGDAPSEESQINIEDFVRRVGSEAVNPMVLFETKSGKTEVLIDMGAEAADDDFEGALAYGLRAADLILQENLNLTNDDIRLVEGVPVPVWLIKQNQGLQPRPGANIPGFYKGQLFSQRTAQALLEAVREERAIQEQEIAIEGLERAFLL